MLFCSHGVNVEFKGCAPVRADYGAQLLSTHQESLVEDDEETHMHFCRRDGKHSKCRLTWSPFAIDTTRAIRPSTFKEQAAYAGRMSQLPMGDRELVIL